jgi:putative oxidoreductase
MRRFEPYAFALLRIVTGLLFLVHGTSKLLKWPPAMAEGMPHPLPPIVLASGTIELIAGLLITLGIFATWAAFIASGEMAVAYFMAHWQFGKASFWPAVNHGEPAVLYCFIFLYIFAHGPGIWSVTKK